MSLKEAVETSKPVDNVYSSTSWPVAPKTNILVPSLLNANPVGVSSWERTLILSTYVTPAKALDDNSVRIKKRRLDTLRNLLK